MNQAFKDPELVALMRKHALELFQLYNSPLKFTINGKEIRATYKGCFLMFPAYKTYNRNRSMIRDWQLHVDLRIRETIESFRNPIFREVFGLSEMNE